MPFDYKSVKTFDKQKLQNLFLSVEWSSGHFPDKLVVAMENSGAVFSAWDGDRLVGLINALDDGAMTAYIHYLLVDPAYQGKGVGRELVRLISERFKDYLRIVLMAYDKEVAFYEKCGYKVGEGRKAMYITSLWT